jgi:hypothetical protein
MVDLEMILSLRPPGMWENVNQHMLNITELFDEFKVE